MKHHPNELMIYYDPGTSIGKQTYAYAYTLTKHVNANVYSSTRMTTTLWRELLDKLELRPKDLLDKSHPDYQAKIARNNFDDEGWLNILMHYPYLIKAPIAVKNNKAVLCCKPTAILKLDPGIKMKRFA
ncbi:arsenate reductase family protein [Roseivirga sp. BDSF3-8]|uniref:arsenate reductase family protein n=1 Tax=Roseivirga sp. BDSF3-8 TaxID=3241598 RepID=UPI003531AAE2